MGNTWDSQSRTCGNCVFWQLSSGRSWGIFGEMPDGVSGDSSVCRRYPPPQGDTKIVDSCGEFQRRDTWRRPEHDVAGVDRLSQKINAPRHAP